MVNHNFGDSRMFRTLKLGAILLDFLKNCALIQLSTASHTIYLKRKKFILNQLGFLFIRAPQEVREP